MNQSVYSLSINGGTPLNCEKYAIEVTRRIQRNQGPGSVSLKVTRWPSDAALINSNDSVVIYRDNAPWFQGTAGSPKKSLAGGIPSHLYEIHDPWRQIEETPYRNVIALPAYAATSQSAWAMLVAFWKQCLSQYFTMTNWTPDVPVLGYAAWPLTNGPMAQSFNSLLSPNIFAATRFDHTTMPPTLQVSNNVGTARILQAHTPGSSSGTIDIDLYLRDDVIPSQVEILGTLGGPGGEQPYVFPLYYKSSPDVIYPAGPIADAGGKWRSATLFDPGASELLSSNGLAKRIFDLMSVPWWEGSCSYADGACTTGIRPGDMLCFTGTNFDPAWSGCNAVVQTVDEDLLKGITHVSLGAHGGKSLRTTFDLICQTLSLRKWATLFTENAWQLSPNKFPLSPFPAAATLPGAGTGAVAIISSIFDNSIAMTGTVTITTGSSGITVDADGSYHLAQVNWTTILYVGSGTVTSVGIVPQTPASTALAVSTPVTPSDQTGFILAVGSAPAANSIYTWRYTANITPP